VKRKSIIVAVVQLVQLLQKDAPGKLNVPDLQSTHVDDEFDPINGLYFPISHA